MNSYSHCFFFFLIHNIGQCIPSSGYIYLTNMTKEKHSYDFSLPSKLWESSYYEDDEEENAIQWKIHIMQ